MALPWPVAPMKATGGRLPRADDTSWVYEPKWDGHRCLARIRGDIVDAVSSTGGARMQRWPFLQSLAGVFDHDHVVLDGEVIAMDETGRHSFQWVGRPDRAHAFVVFDVLQLDGLDLCPLPWQTRRDCLESILTPTPEVFVTPVTDDSAALMAATKAQAMEGIIAKRTDSAYLPGRRTTSWLKVKHRYQQEFVVGGYLLGEGNRSDAFGSVLVGFYDGDRLQFCGAAGSGFTELSLGEMQAHLRRLATDECPFDPVPKFPRGKARWVHPEVVAEVSFAEWTDDVIMRHPVFMGIRDDKPARAVTREI